MSYLQIIITTEFLVSNAFHKIKTYFSLEDGILPSKFGMSEWRINLLERFMDQLFLQILWITKMELYLQETTKIMIFCNCGILNQVNLFRHLILRNQVMVIPMDSLHHLLINQLKNILELHFLGLIKSKFLKTRK